ncbi:hypothetical protein N7539_008245 [Penicillium diatomitis]|uniref:Uncharacterized protein n=1 Tax=Penicillium diatomitis TaxID=2819901 RepID=A0A9W9WTF9_9EURO|nr:uncharacterized protein N7539_008245 [Penicillium diatomitis]KAJ5475179.1 hypothetical protein N7539_008245 [Penicillium diatomitis]
MVRPGPPRVRERERGQASVNQKRRDDDASINFRRFKSGLRRPTFAPLDGGEEPPKQGRNGCAGTGHGLSKKKRLQGADLPGAIGFYSTIEDQRMLIGAEEQSSDATVVGKQC